MAGNILVSDGTSGNTVTGTNNPGLWAGLSELVDTTNVSSDLSRGLLVHEFDLAANGLDTAGRRAGIILALTKNNPAGAAVEASLGIGVAGPVSTDGSYKDVYKVGAAFSHAAISMTDVGAVQLPGANAIWLADGHKIAFDTVGANTLSFTGGALTTGGNLVVGGTLGVTGATTHAGTVTLSGLTFMQLGDPLGTNNGIQFPPGRGGEQSVPSGHRTRR